MLVRKLTVGLTLIALVLIAVPVLAQETGPQVSVTQAWQGHTRVPGWIEIEYTLSQESDAWDGAIFIYDTANTITYRTPVNMPQHSQKLYRIPLLSSDGFNLSSNLLSEDYDSQPYKLPIVHLDNKRVCAYIGSALSQHIIFTECRTLLRLQSPAELPETPMVWDNVDVLIINGINTNDLSDKQTAAMVAWVASGGHLVLSGGIALNLTLTPLPTTLHIVEAGPVTILKDIPEINSNKGEIAAAQLKLLPGAFTLIESESTDLAARKFIGKGLVDVIGWDITQVDSTNWLQELWRDDPIPATAIKPFGNMTTSAQMGPSVYELQEIPDNPMPKLWVWFIMFILYIILIGPVTMLVVRRIDKPIYTWVMIPLWIVIALIIMSATLSNTYGKTFPLIHDIAYISMNGKDLPARVVQGTAISAPQSRNITWSTSGYVRPLWGQHAGDSWNYSGTPYPIMINYQSPISQIATGKPNGMITWGVEGIIDGIEMEANLSLSFLEETPVITGSFYSVSDLTNVSLVLQGSSSQTVQLVHNYSANDTVSVSTTIPISPSYAESAYSVCGMSESPFRALMVKPIQPPSSTHIDKPVCYIAALSIGVPFPTSDIAGAYTGESCLIKEISCPAQAPGELSTNLLGYASGNDGGWMDTAMNILSPHPPESTFTYHLPDFINAKQINAIIVSLESLGEPQSQSLVDSQSIALSLWDWQKSLWVEQPLVEAGEANGFTIHLQKPEANRFFDTETQTIQVRLKIPDNTYPQFRLPIRIEGIW